MFCRKYTTVTDCSHTFIYINNQTIKIRPCGVLQKLKVFSDGWLGRSESQSIGDDDVHLNLKKKIKKRGPYFSATPWLHFR